MDKTITRDMRRQIKRNNAKQPLTLQPVPSAMWPDVSRMAVPPFAVWRSRYYLVQGFKESDGVTRISVARTTMLPNGRWEDGLSWDELQEIKRQIGLGDCQAIEIYPRDKDIVNVANMRHLWVLSDSLNIGWVRS